MREHVRKKMLDDYSKKLNFKGKCTCIKYRYVYNNVIVNLYFDAYDVNSNSLTLILSTERQFYFTPLNIMNTSIRKEYLPEIPSVFLHKILVNNELDTFYAHMEASILKAEPYATSYKKDIVFSTTVKSQKNKIDLPFWWHLRNKRMSDNTLEQLSERADITRKTLLNIQSKGFTLVRTDDSNKRRKLKLILNDEGIQLE